MTSPEKGAIIHLSAASTPHKGEEPPQGNYQQRGSPASPEKPPACNRGASHLLGPLDTVFGPWYNLFVEVAMGRGPTKEQIRRKSYTWAKKLAKEYKGERKGGRVYIPAKDTLPRVEVSLQVVRASNGEAAGFPMVVAVDAAGNREDFGYFGDARPRIEAAQEFLRPLGRNILLTP